MIDRHVPCNGCTACCRGTHIELRLERGDHPFFHRGNTVIVAGKWMLKHKLDTDECVYLGEKGCTLYGKRERPHVCREFDCREMPRLERKLDLRLIDFTPEMREAARRLSA